MKEGKDLMKEIKRTMNNSKSIMEIVLKLDRIELFQMSGLHEHFEVLNLHERFEVLLLHYSLTTEYNLQYLIQFFVFFI
jgi:ABC-type phosphate transport system auxiliary subunit